MKYVLLILLLATAVFAHLDAGIDNTVDGYLVDVGYAPATPVPDQPTSFVINLLNASTSDQIYPASVWIRISNAEQVLFAASFAPVDGNTAFTYTFSKQGNYEILTRFQSNQSTLVETTFPLRVARNDTSRILITSAATLIIFLLLTRWLITRRKKSKSHGF